MAGHCLEDFIGRPVSHREADVDGGNLDDAHYAAASLKNGAIRVSLFRRPPVKERGACLSGRNASVIFVCGQKLCALSFPAILLFDILIVTSDDNTLAHVPDLTHKGYVDDGGQKRVGQNCDQDPEETIGLVIIFHQGSSSPLPSLCFLKSRAPRSILPKTKMSAAVLT